MATQHNTKTTLTDQMLTWIDDRNGIHNVYPSYTAINNYYKKISGSNSFSHHLPNLRNERTQRTCGRYIKKLSKSWPIKHEVGGYMLKYRKVHPQLEGLNKLKKRLKYWLTSARKATLHPNSADFLTAQDNLADVWKTIETCYADYNYTLHNDTLKHFNQLYNLYGKPVKVYY